MKDTEFPAVPKTADEMLYRWAERDAEYAKSKVAMPPEQAAGIREGRMQEANRLPQVKDRGFMYTRAKAWVPPVPQDFGGLRDWL